MDGTSTITAAIAVRSGWVNYFGIVGTVQAIFYTPPDNSLAQAGGYYAEEHDKIDQR